MNSSEQGRCALGARPPEGPNHHLARIRWLNDRLRTQFVGGDLYLTDGIFELDEKVVEVLHQVATFSSFAADNDPYDEHDFGVVECLGRRILWKIDYYDRSKEFGSPDPSDEAVTARVFTIMLASEY